MWGSSGNRCHKTFPVSPSTGTEMETGTSEKNIGELAAKIAKNALKLIAEKNMKFMKRFEVY